MEYTLVELRRGKNGLFNEFRMEAILGDREEVQGLSPIVGGPGYAFVYAPKGEEAKYKELLAAYVSHCLERQIQSDTRLLASLTDLRRTL